MEIKLSEHQIDALLWAIELAYGDQEHYIRFGDPHLDYGDEWPTTAYGKAEHLKQLAQIARTFNDENVAQKCETLANEL